MSKVLLFDIDGTLIETGGAGSLALGEALRNTFGLAESNRVPMHGRTDAGIVAELFKVNGIESHEENRNRFLRCYFDLLPVVLKRLQGRVLPGVQSLLQQLIAQDDFRLTLLTGNMARSARMKLEHFALEEYFTGGVFGDHHPDRCDLGRTAVETLTEQLGETIDPTEMVVIGDTHLDIQCARAIGCKVLAVATGGCSVEELDDHGADRVVTDLTQVDLVEWLRTS